MILTLVLTRDDPYKLTANLLRLLLVCKHFEVTLKPILFQSVWLRSLYDINRLQCILRSNGSLLRDCPRWMRLGGNEDTRHNTRRVVGDGGLQYGGTSSRLCGDGDSLHLPVNIRARLRQHHSLRRLYLSNCVFQSFSALLRLLSALPSLEEIFLKNVRWRVPFSSSNPDCSGSFANLRMVECFDTSPEIWAISWIFAAAGAGWTFRRKHISRDGEDINPIPTDTHAIVMIIKTFYVALDYRAFELVAYKEEGMSLRFRSQ